MQEEQYNECELNDKFIVDHIQQLTPNKSYTLGYDHFKNTRHENVTQWYVQISS